MSRPKSLYISVILIGASLKLCNVLTCLNLRFSQSYTRMGLSSHTHSLLEPRDHSSYVTSVWLRVSNHVHLYNYACAVAVHVIHYVRISLYHIIIIVTLFCVIVFYFLLMLWWTAGALVPKTSLYFLKHSLLWWASTYVCTLKQTNSVTGWKGDIGFSEEIYWLQSQRLT